MTSSNTPDAFGINSATSGSSSEYQWNGSAGYRTEGLSPTGMGSLYSFQKVGARYYDPTFGCFLTRDTYLDQKPYAYCDGDPVNEVDPDGHDPGGQGTGSPKPKPPTWPWQWGKGDMVIEVNVDIGIDKGIKGGVGIKTTIPINGPEYWGHMPAPDRAKTHTFVQFVAYVYKHLHTSAN